MVHDLGENALCICMPACGGPEQHGVKSHGQPKVAQNYCSIMCEAYAKGHCKQVKLYASSNCAWPLYFVAQSSRTCT